MSKNKQINESNLFPESKIPSPTAEQAAKIASVSKIKDVFSKLVLDFRSTLKDPTLSSNRTSVQKEKQNQVLHELNDNAGQLEKLNSGEGIFSLIFLSLNSLFSLRDEINDIKFQNMMLHKKLKSLEEKIDK